jgi:2-polyprenyl-3-methyl-5-hydroxy-6-metoxy-1,4-benzoquinol methylase
MSSGPLFAPSFSSWRVAESFVRLLQQELSFRRARDLDDSYLRLRYEPAFFSRQGRFNHLAVRGYATRLSPLMDEIRRRGAPRLLDSGSGIGSESILAALLGADVTGMDLAPSKIAYAASRIPFYEEIGHRPLALKFIAANVIGHLRDAPGYDLVWANEAISHIHPAEEFVAAAFQGLRPGGWLVIADANALNPVARWRAARLRGSSDWYVHRRSILSNEALADDVAEERLFTSRTLPALLRQAGFQVRQLDVHGFMGSFFLPRAWQFSSWLGAIMAAFQQGAKRVPLVRRLGSSMTVIAEKGGGA